MSSENQISDKNPIIVYEKYRPNGELKSVIQYLDEVSVKQEKFYQLPVWKIALFFMLLLALFIILIASIVLSTSKRSAFYQENCDGRSCLKVLNLKCLNRTCSCVKNQYYLKGCFNKINYLETGCLKNSNYCADGKNLTCVDGACKCSNTSFWSGTNCYLKSSYGGYCTTNEQCFADSKIICDINRKKCLCNSNRFNYTLHFLFVVTRSQFYDILVSRFWDGNVCYLKATVNENCNTALPCNDNYNLNCQNGTCLYVFFANYCINSFKLFYK